MGYKKDKVTTLNVRVSKELKERYYGFCKENGYSISKRIRIVLENDIKNG
jgi:antitoxin component of RelBE/YafQ-DinJ toxin-antitoxin module